MNWEATSMMEEDLEIVIGSDKPWYYVRDHGSWILPDEKRRVSDFPKLAGGYPNTLDVLYMFQMDNP